MNAKFDITNVILETNRLILRPFELDDLDDFFEYAKVEGVGEMAGWIHHANKNVTLNILNNFIDHKKTFAIVYKENNKVIGSIGIEYYKCEEKFSEFYELFGRQLGFVLSKEYWGKGIICEACLKIISYLFDQLNYDFMLCSHFDFNNQSRRVQEKLSFKPYRKLIMNDALGNEVPATLNLLLNQNKTYHLEFSHPETLIYNKD